MAGFVIGFIGLCLTMDYGKNFDWENRHTTTCGRSADSFGVCSSTVSAAFFLGQPFCYLACGWGARI